MTSSIFRLGILSLMILYVKCDDLDYCYARDNNPLKPFSTWTPPAMTWVYVENKDSGCKPIYIWGLFKHGVKSFTDEQIKRSNTLFKVEMDISDNDKESTALCAEDYDKIRSLNNLDLNTKEREEEMIKKAHFQHEMFASHLKGIMSSAPGFSSSDKTQIQIQTSEIGKTRQSAVNFAKIFLGNSEAKVDDIISENDELLKARSSCANWKSDHNEADRFFSSPVIQSLRQEVSFRLGFYSEVLSMETILALYESCMFGYIFSPLNKPHACVAFTPVHLKMLEYYQDLKHFYDFGPGNDLSEKMGCPLIKDMTEKLVTAASGKWEEKEGGLTVSQWTGKRVNINIGDEENLMGMITKMGLYRDERTPKHYNYYSQKTNRKWRSSLLSPFDGSVHAVLYNCKNKEKKVEFYHNHDLVKFDACKSNLDGSCPLDVFLTEMKKNLNGDKCDTEYCGRFPQKPPQNENKNGGSMISYSFLVTAVCFIFNRFMF